MSVGDVVQLLSGGPIMTVVDVTEGAVAACVWHTATGELRSASFPMAALRQAKRQP